MSYVVTQENYEELVEKSTGLIILDVWAPWCTPCKIIEPIIDSVSVATGVELVKLNVEEAPTLTSNIGIGALPTIRLLKDGKVLFETVGTFDRSKLEAAISGAAL